MFLVHFTPSFKLENSLADDFLKHYSIESEFYEIYGLFYIIFVLTKNSPNRMMLRLGESWFYANFSFFPYSKIILSVMTAFLFFEYTLLHGLSLE